MDCRKKLPIAKNSLKLQKKTSNTEKESVRLSGNDSFSSGERDLERLVLPHIRKEDKAAINCVSGETLSRILNII